MCNVIIALAKGRIGIERVGILTQEIVVAIVVEAADRIGIDIDACTYRRLSAAECRISVSKPALRFQTFVLVGHPGNPLRISVRQRRNERFPIGEGCQRVDKDIIILSGFIVHVITADTEVEGAGEMRCQPEFLAGLPGMLFGKIFRHYAAATAQLRIAIDSVRIGELGGYTIDGDGNEIWLEYSGRRIETVVIFSRP